ncbi:MAG: hypothetical protein GY926_16150, partial [bacterium]|nr:hypothetical protein [bacterium]
MRSTEQNPTWILGLTRTQWIASLVCWVLVGLIAGLRSLHAATHIPANARALRERLCRYISRPPLAQGRLSLTDDGGVLWKLRSPWRDGTKAFRFDPLVFIERLVA